MDAPKNLMPQKGIGTKSDVLRKNELAVPQLGRAIGVVEITQASAKKKELAGEGRSLRD